MAKKMTGQGREMDILAFLHRNRIVNDQWVTVGEYARFAGISRSPYLTKVFNNLIDRCWLSMQQEPYRATVMYTFSPNYEHIEKYYPEVKTELIQKVGAWKE